LTVKLDTGQGLPSDLTASLSCDAGVDSITITYSRWDQISC